LEAIIVSYLARVGPCVELDLRSCPLSSIRKVLVEGSAVKNPGDRGLTLEMENLA
jgi:hypothetical protein